MQLKYKKILLIIILLALVLRLNHLGDKAFGTDEKPSINNSKIILNEGLSKVKDFGNPPGFYFLGGIIFLANSILLFKIIMVIFGLLTIFLTYYATTKLLDEKSAIITSILLAINPMHILYSQHIRVYIVLMFVYLFSIFLLWQFIKTKKNNYLIGLTLTYAIAVYLHYFSAIFILAEIITFFVITKDKKLIKKFLIALFVAGILCLPLIPYFLSQYNYMITQGNLNTIELLNPLKAPYPIYKFSSMLDISSTLSKAPYLIVTFPLVFFAFILGIIKLYKEKREETKFIALNFILPIIILAVIGFLAPVYSFRYLTYLLPLYLVPIAYNYKDKKLGVLLLLLITVLWTIILIKYYSIVVLTSWPIDFAI